MKKIFYIIFCLTLISAPLFVLAQGETGGGTGTTGGNSNTPTQTLPVTISNPFKGGNTLDTVITTFLNSVVMPVAAVFIVLAIIYAGFKYVTAQGKPEEIKKANQGLMYVLIGAGVLLGAAGISAAIHTTICTDLISC